MRYVWSGVVGLATAAFGQPTVVFSWEHDAADPMAIEPGEVVRVSLWAEWERADGEAYPMFAGSRFLIADLAGGEAFFASDSVVNINPLDGYGRNPLLSAASRDNGVFRDGDGDGQIDGIGPIDVYQLPPAHNPQVIVENRVLIYTLAWTAGSEPGVVSLSRAATIDGSFHTVLFTGPYGMKYLVPTEDEVLELRVVPGPWSLVVGGLGCCFLAHRRRRVV